jgi:hypothetical protein
LNKFLEGEASKVSHSNRPSAVWPITSAKRFRKFSEGTFRPKVTIRVDFLAENGHGFVSIYSCVLREVLAFFPELQPASFSYTPRELVGVFPNARREGVVPDFGSAGIHTCCLLFHVSAKLR